MGLGFHRIFPKRLTMVKYRFSAVVLMGLVFSATSAPAVTEACDAHERARLKLVDFQRSCLDSPRMEKYLRVTNLTEFYAVNGLGGSARVPKKVAQGILNQLTQCRSHSVIQILKRIQKKDDLREWKFENLELLRRHAKNVIERDYHPTLLQKDSECRGRTAKLNHHLMLKMESEGWNPQVNHQVEKANDAEIDETAPSGAPIRSKNSKVAN